MCYCPYCRREIDSRSASCCDDRRIVIDSKLAAYEKTLQKYGEKSHWACSNDHPYAKTNCIADRFIPIGRIEHGFVPAREVLGLDKQRQLECLDCKHVWTAPWSLETKCPKCGRGFTLPENQQENGNAEDHNRS